MKKSFGVAAFVVSFIGLTSYLSQLDTSSAEPNQVSSLAASEPSQSLYKSEPLLDNSARWTKEPLVIEPGAHYARFVSHAKGVVVVPELRKPLALYASPEGAVLTHLTKTKDGLLAFKAEAQGVGTALNMEPLHELGLEFEQATVGSERPNPKRAAIELPFYERKIIGNQEGVHTWVKVGSPTGTRYYWIKSDETAYPLSFEQKGSFTNWPSQGSVLCAELTSRCLVVDEQLESLFNEFALSTERTYLWLQGALKAQSRLKEGSKTKGAANNYVHWQQYEAEQLLRTRAELQGAHNYQYLEKQIPSIEGLIEHAVQGQAQSQQGKLIQALLSQVSSLPLAQELTLRGSALSKVLEEKLGTQSRFFFRTRNVYDTPETF